MARFIALQSGHENIQNNCNLDLRDSTGAPGEKDFTVRTRNRLSEILQQKGFQVQLVDANFNCLSENQKDFDLFVAIHYDADIYGKGGGFIGIPDASIDFAHEESKRIQQALIEEYFKNTGIENRPERSNPKVTYYYMWSSLSAKTPCVLIECGVGQDAHDKVILADTDRVTNAIARGICKAFDVIFDPPTPPLPAPQPPIDSQTALINTIREIVWGKGWTWTKINKLKALLPK